MSKIRIRAKGGDIKVLDKSIIVGQRMKNAFIRSKRNTAALMDGRRVAPIPKLKKRMTAWAMSRRTKPK